MIGAAPAHFRSAPNLAARWLLPAALLIAEIATLDGLYDAHAAIAATPAWLAFNQIAKHALYAGLYALGALVLLLIPRRAALRQQWSAAPQPWRAALAANLAIFAALAAATLALRANGAFDTRAFFGLAFGVSCLALSAALVAASAAFWTRFVRGHGGDIALAALVGALIALTAFAAQNSWQILSGATLRLSYALLSLVEPTAMIAPQQQLLGAGSFRVIINAACSGYEGCGLVLSALGLYVWLFRKQLRFPAVLWLFPIGVVAIWLLNSVRIAALVAIGANVSPQIAMGGFHSQAGWLLFLAVTGALMAWAHAHFRTDAQKRPADPAVRLAFALIAPFAALMAARMTGAIFGADAPLIAAALIALPAYVLWRVRGTIGALLGPLRAEPILAGLVVGALWLATEPAGAGAPSWLVGQPPAAIAAWAALRIFGFVLIVPIAEELLFRGYLHRALVQRRFDEAPQAAFSWPAFVITSLLFGALHQRWLAGALAGAVFAIVLYRSKTIGGPIAAHIAANGLIAGYALITGAWALL